MANSFNLYVAGCGVLTSDASSGVVAPAANTQYLLIPTANLVSWGTMSDLNKGEEIAFTLVDTLAPKLALAAQANGLQAGATAINGISSTESSRVNGEGVIRKDFAIRFDIAYDEEDLDVIA